MKKPNIILISIDTLRADHLSCYGYPRLTSANLDRIASEGVLYRNAYSTAAWTPPAHASMLTGLHPSQHGVIRDNRLSGTIPTIAEVMSRNGYNTAGFVNNSQVGELVGLDRGHRYFDEVWKGVDKRQFAKRLIHKVKSAAGMADKGAAETNRRAVNWVAKTRASKEPFYMFLHYIETHNPLMAPHPFRYRFVDSGPSDTVDLAKLWKVAHNPLVCFTNNIDLTDVEKDALTALYDEEIAYMDSIIGDLFARLKSAGVLDDTAIIITADHGEHLGERQLYSHAASLYEPITHIPMILYYPARFAPRTDQSLVQLTDIFPTILELTGAHFDGAAALPGKSLAGKPDSARFAVAEWEGRVPHFVRSRGLGRAEFGESFFMERIRMIRQGNFKYVSRSMGSDELYDLIADPYEKCNLLPHASGIGEPLRLKLDSYMEGMGTATLVERHENEDVKRNLEALGYM